MARVHETGTKGGCSIPGITRVSRTGDLKRIVFDANLQTTKVGAGVVESTPMKRYISVIEENGAWRIEGFYKTMPDDDK